jgi:hypothetical protein
MSFEWCSSCGHEKHEGRVCNQEDTGWTCVCGGEVELKSVIYREALGFNGQPGNVLCEMEDDVPPRVGDIIELSIRDHGVKKRYVVESLAKEIYDNGVTFPPDKIVKQIVWMVGVTRLRGGSRILLDEGDLDWLRDRLLGDPAGRRAMSHLLGTEIAGDATADGIIQELWTRLS